MMRSLTKLILCGVLAALSAASADAGPLRNLFARGRCPGAGCQPPAPQPAPAWVPATLAGYAQPVVVQTSYSGVGVPVDATPYQPIQVGRPLPVAPRQFAPQLFSPPVWGGYCPTCPQGGCGR
jgi:hypothetical protein